MRQFCNFETSPSSAGNTSSSLQSVTVLFQDFDFVLHSILILWGRTFNWIIFFTRDLVTRSRCKSRSHPRFFQLIHRGYASSPSGLGSFALYNQSLTCVGPWTTDSRSHDRSAHKSKVFPPCACSSGTSVRTTERTPCRSTHRRTASPWCACASRDYRGRRARRTLCRSGGTWKASRRCAGACACAIWTRPWTPWCSRGTCTDAPHCGPASVYWDWTTARSVFRTRSTGEDDVSHAREGYVCEVGLVSRTSDCRGCKGTSCRLGPRNACTWDACLCSIHRRTLYRNDRRHNCHHLEKWYKRNVDIFHCRENELNWQNSATSSL